VDNHHLPTYLPTYLSLLPALNLDDLVVLETMILIGNGCSHHHMRIGCCQTYMAPLYVTAVIISSM